MPAKSDLKEIESEYKIKRMNRFSTFTLCEREPQDL